MSYIEWESDIAQFPRVFIYEVHNRRTKNILTCADKMDKEQYCVGYFPEFHYRGEVDVSDWETHLSNRTQTLIKEIAKAPVNRIWSTSINNSSHYWFCDLIGKGN